MRRWLSVLWVLAPLALGLPSPLTFGWAAWRLRSRAIAVEAALYFATTVAFFVLAGDTDANTNTIGGIVGLGLMGVATVRGLVLRRRVFDLDPAPSPVEPTVVPPADWRPVFPADDRPLRDPYNPATWTSVFACTGVDQHQLGVSPLRLVGYAFGGVMLIALSAWHHVAGRGLSVGIGMAITPLVVVLFSQRLDGPALRYRFWGVTHALRLDSVTKVATTSGRGGSGILVLTAPGHRRPVRVALRARSYRAPTNVRDHFRGWLDRPGVELTPTALALLRGDNLATQEAPKRRTRVQQALALALTVVLPLGALGVAAWVTYQSRASRRIPGAPGYQRYGGPHGRLLAVGRPWGRPCQPVRFVAEQTVPRWIYTELVAVVGEARRGGIDVTVETRNFFWSPGSLYVPPGQTPEEVPRVVVFVDDTTRKLDGGHLESIRLGWDAELDSDHDHEHLTYAQGVLDVRAITGDLPATRRAIRQLVALTQGVIRASNHDSGLRDGSPIDRFTAPDFAAMQLMSGCGHLTLPALTITST